MEAIGALALWASAILNLPGALALAWGMAEGLLVGKHWSYKLAVMIMMIGLIGQFARSYIAITTGIAPTDAEIPFWFLKDFGIVMLGAHYVLKITKGVK